MVKKRIDPIEVDGYNVMKGVIKSNCRDYHNILAENVQALFKIIKGCGFTELEAIDKIHSDISRDTKLSLWDITAIVRKEVK